MDNPLLASQEDSINYKSIPMNQPIQDSISETSSNVRHSEIKNQLGTINGCYIPCLLNIMGIILFLRLGWAVGQAGVLVVLGFLLLAETQTILTVLSLSALTSNGNMSTGGSYYLISRSLGPEFGGSIGLMFYAAYAVGVAFYIIGFAETVQTTFLPTIENPEWIIRGIGSAGLFCMLIISLVGAGFFAKFNTIFFIIQFLSILIGLVSFYIPHNYEGQYPNGTFYDTRASFPDHMASNIMPSWAASDSCNGVCDFHKVFGILFPMVTGIMEGANLSGDLKDPAKSIPRGTLGAVGTSIFFYIVLILAFAGGMSAKDLQQDQNVFQNATFGSKYIVVVGIIISSLSSALGSLFGGSRVLQAMARDKLSVLLKPFAYGSKHGDEPRVAVVLTWLIAQACVMIGDIDVVAPIISAFFCLSYAMCNITCFFLSAMSAPNFRPTFRYYSWHTALLGFLLNMGVMIYLAWQYALITFSIMFVIFVALAVYGPATDWGDISNELLFHQVRKYLLRIDGSKSHAKYWKPNILLLLDDCDTGLIGFCNSLKKGGLFIIGQVLLGDIVAVHPIAHGLKKAWMEFIKRARLKAFAHTVVVPDPKVGTQVLATTAGLGGLSINTVVLPFYEKQTRYFEQTQERLEALKEHLESNSSQARPHANIPASSSLEYCEIIQNLIMLEKNVILSRNFGDASIGSKGRLYSPTSSKRNIDVWIFGNWQMQPTRSRSNSLQGHDLVTPRLPKEYDIHTSTESLSMHNIQEPIRGDSISIHQVEQEEGNLENVVFEGLFSLLIQLGETLYLSRLGPGGRATSRKRHFLRVFHVPTTRAIGNAAPLAHAHYLKHLKRLCNAARLHVKADNLQVVMPSDLIRSSQSFARAVDHHPDDDNISIDLDHLRRDSRCRIINEVVQSYSSDTCQVFLPLPAPPSDSEAACQAYLDDLSAMTHGLPPVALVANGEMGAFISTDI